MTCIELHARDELGVRNHNNSLVQTNKGFLNAWMKTSKSTRTLMAAEISHDKDTVHQN